MLNHPASHRKNQPQAGHHNGQLPCGRLPLNYNAIIGRVTIIPSTYHLKLKFTTEQCVREMRGDQVATQKCYMASLKGRGLKEPSRRKGSSERRKNTPAGRTIQEPDRGWQVAIEEGRPDKTVRVGSLLPENLRDCKTSYEGTWICSPGYMKTSPALTRDHGAQVECAPHYPTSPAEKADVHP
jgi:hypothetical protein